jgi:glycosyltransferase involved in cell wall biosynthesis
MKIAAVVQRYGADIVGGAERLCRGVGEGLAARGHEVEVMTSCARSYRTWANAYPEGVEQTAGVRVRRFRVEQERDMGAFNTASEELFGKPADAAQQTAWVKAQGPYVPRLVDHLHGAAADFDRLLFFTYLYYPTVHGIQVAPERSVLVPTAHDEAPIYLAIYDPVFALPAGLVFNTEAEAAFVRRRFPRASGRQQVIGVGIDGLDALAGIDGDVPSSGMRAGRETGAMKIASAGPEAPPSGAETAEEGLSGPTEGDSPGDRPALLYAGRIEPGKGVGRLIEQLGRFRDETGIDTRLWLIGELAMELPMEKPESEWIEVLGFVSEAEKVRRLRAATVLVAPSPLESFGIVALEAMAAGTPPLVNAAAQAAVEHCRNADAGLWYHDYAEFHAALELLLRDPRLRAAMAKKGASYVREHYSWPRIIDRYEQFLRNLAPR